MTTPPDDSPYESDIRANTSTGLGGLFAQLAAIAAGIGALPQLLVAVQQIAADLRKLVGDSEVPNGYNGLPSVINTLLTRATYLTGTNAPNPGFGTGGVPNYLATVLYDRRDIGNGTLALWETLNIVTNGLVRGSTEEAIPYLREIELVLGSIAAAPNGSSIKDLLRSIDVNALRTADCCEDGGTVDPPPDEPPANTLPAVEGTCAEDRQGPFQCTGFFRLNPPEITPAIFGLKFDGLEAVSTWFAVQDGVYGASFLHYESATDKQVCLVWDLTGNPQPSQGGYVIDGDNPPVWSSGNATVFNVTTNGSASFFDNTLSSGVAFYVRLVLDDPALLPNYRNFWLYWSEAPV